MNEIIERVDGTIIEESSMSIMDFSESFSRTWTSYQRRALRLIKRLLNIFSYG